MTIDALAWLEKYEAERRESPAHMYGVRSYIDSECTTDYDPHVHAADLSLPVVINDSMPTPQMVACYSARHRAVFIRPNLNTAVERCALAHEIVHFEHDDIGTTRSQEDRADRIAARRLIRPSRLEEVASTTDDHARMALELNVTERIMRFYLRGRGI